MRRTLALLLLVIAPSCSRPVRPDDMSAARHRHEAERERQATIAHLDKYDPDAEVTTIRHVEAPDSNDAYSDLPGYNPTRWHIEEAERHHDHALAHERAAAELEAFEDATCDQIPPGVRAACPLLGPVRVVEEIPHGVRIRFEAGVPVEKVAAHIRCHLAFARTRGFEIPGCPLTVRGTSVVVTPDHTAVELTTSGRGQIRRLRQDARKLAPSRSASRE